jgi:hypothetical protein
MNDFASRHLKVHHLSVDFNRIMALLKDFSSGFISKFPHLSIQQELDKSYLRIQALKKK